jgi:hypothetical protein
MAWLVDFLLAPPLLIPSPASDPLRRVIVDVRAALDHQNNASLESEIVHLVLQIREIVPGCALIVLLLESPSRVPVQAREWLGPPMGGPSDLALQLTRVLRTSKELARLRLQGQFAMALDGADFGTGKDCGFLYLSPENKVSSTEERHMPGVVAQKALLYLGPASDDHPCLVWLSRAEAKTLALFLCSYLVATEQQKNVPTRKNAFIHTNAQHIISLAEVAAGLLKRTRGLWSLSLSGIPFHWIVFYTLCLGEINSSRIFQAFDRGGGQPWYAVATEKNTLIPLVNLGVNSPDKKPDLLPFSVHLDGGHLLRALWSLVTAEFTLRSSGTTHPVGELPPPHDFSAWVFRMPDPVQRAKYPALPNVKQACKRSHWWINFVACGSAYPLAFLGGIEYETESQLPSNVSEHLDEVIAQGARDRSISTTRILQVVLGSLSADANKPATD